MLTFLGLIAPIFFIVVGVEYMLGKMMGKEIYHFSDAMTNMTAGMAERLFDFFYAIIMLFVFKWIFDNFAITELPRTPLMWVCCLVLYDFLYYWYHRTGHEANFLWAVHIVHHQSENYNLTVGSRQSGFQAIARTFFLSVLPIVGFVPEFAWTVFIVGGTHQFFLHTQLIGKLGPLEYIFVTPSLHRVHHGRNDKYLDKNYGGIFIWWDMIFGTYQREEDEVKYGITTGLPSNNVYWAYFHYWVDLFKQAKKIEGFGNKVKLFVKRPGWTPQGMMPPSQDKNNGLDRALYDPKAPLDLSIYVFVQVALGMGLLSAMLIKKGKVTDGYDSLMSFYTEFMPLPEVLMYTVLITMATLTVPVLLEKKKWAYQVEHVRLAFMALGVPFVLMGIEVGDPIGSLVAGVFLAFSVWLYRMRHNFNSKDRPSRISAKLENVRSFLFK